jgi:EF hand
MTPKLRQQRSVFLLFLGACFVALMAALPIVTAQTAKQLEAQKQQPAAGGTSARAAASDEPDFDRADRNKDGYVDKSEAGVVPGLSANFERADRSKDGKLDREEFLQGLQILQVRR